MSASNDRSSLRRSAIVAVALLAGLALIGCGDDPPACEGAACLADAGTRDDDAGARADAAVELVCTDTCEYASDGECDDGGPDAAYDVCALGTDCADCGPRDPSVVCTPDCSGRSCGSDGCGGSCGEGCSAGERCDASGTCIDDGCVQDCSGRECGPDPVCGALCGSCTGGDSCSGAGACVCRPMCDGRTCGDDGCGGSCGSCSGGATCNAAGACELGFRPHAGPTARLRLINGDLLTASAGRKVCLFGAGDDRPYAVLNALGFARGTTVTVNATYVEVPAGIALRASHSITVGAGTATAEGCVASDAQPLGTAALASGGHYTAVVRTYDEFFTGACAANAAEDHCEFYGRSRTSEAEVPCADQGVFLFEDGLRLGGSYTGAFRVVNLTSNAAMISSSETRGAQTLHGNVAGGSGVGTGYNVPESRTVLRFCPRYLECDPSLTPLARIDAMYDCSDADPAWMLAEVTSTRLTARDRNTTLYVFGNAGRVNTTGTGIIADDLGIVIAHDVTDGALP